MTITQKVYVGDTGTEIILDCGSNISGATGLSIEVLKPSGALITWSATLEGTTSVKHVVLANELDEIGTWVMQAHVELTTWQGLGESQKMKVYAPFT